MTSMNEGGGEAAALISSCCFLFHQALRKGACSQTSASHGDGWLLGKATACSAAPACRHQYIVRPGFRQGCPVTCSRLLGTFPPPLSVCSRRCASCCGPGVGHGWTSSVDNGWDAQPSGWGSPPRNAPLFTVKVYIHVDPK